MTLDERFWSKVDKTPSCWLWTGTKTPWGYGTLQLVQPRRKASAHRLAWEMERGPIPGGMSVLHRCDNPACVRVTHLFLGTHRDNMRDMHAKHRGRSADACRWGHRWTPENTYIDSRGHRVCRTCTNAAHARYAAARKATTMTADRGLAALAERLHDIGGDCGPLDLSVSEHRAFHDAIATAILGESDVFLPGGRDAEIEQVHQQATHWFAEVERLRAALEDVLTANIGGSLQRERWRAALEGAEP